MRQMRVLEYVGHRPRLPPLEEDAGAVRIAAAGTAEIARLETLSDGGCHDEAFLRVVDRRSEKLSPRLGAVLIVKCGPSGEVTGDDRRHETVARWVSAVPEPRARGEHLGPGVGRRGADEVERSYPLVP